MASLGRSGSGSERRGRRVWETGVRRNSGRWGHDRDRCRRTCQHGSLPGGIGSAGRSICRCDRPIRGVLSLPGRRNRSLAVRAWRLGLGDSNWPKSILYIAGWGWGDATLNGAPLHQEYQIHFMVTQGMRDRETLAVQTDRTGTSGAGAVNPAMVQLDFYIRSPEANEANHPARDVFDHFFATAVTWR